MNSEERAAAIKAEQETMSPEDIATEMRQRSEYTVDLNDLPKHAHRWIERGLKISCEGAAHPHHSHFKVGR